MKLYLILLISIFLMATDEIPKEIEIPKGYSVLSFTKGDLNFDEFQDAILILKHKDEDREDYKRPLYILIGDSKGKFKVVAENNNSVLGYSDGGIYGDPFTGVTIKKGYFSIEHYGGSNWRWTRIVTFKYDKKKKDWFLYKDGGESYHISKPQKITTDIATTKDFGIVPFSKFNIFN